MTIPAPTYYELLDVAADADLATIDAAYERLSQQYDPARLATLAPDVRALAATRYAQLATAYATLQDTTARAAYDQTLAANHEAALDYRPLPPRRATSVVRPIAESARRGWLNGWLLLTVAGLLTLGGTALLLWLGTRPAAPNQVQMPFSASVIIAEITDPAVRDHILSFDAMAEQGRAAVQQDPRNPAAWVFLGNAHYDFMQIIYEHAPDGEAYNQNLSRWLQATDAYSRALRLNPLQPIVRSDYALALIRYGLGFGNPTYVAQGLAEAERALREDNQTPQVLLNVGRAFALAQPPRTAEARALWQQVGALDADGRAATQAEELLGGARP